MPITKNIFKLLIYFCKIYSLTQHTMKYQPIQNYINGQFVSSGDQQYHAGGFTH